MSMIQIQATAIGYGGKPRTLFSAYDELARVLVLSVEADYRIERRPGCVVLTNESRRDMPRERLYTQDDIKDAIDAFFSLQQGVASDGRSPRLVVSEKAARANPLHSIEKDGMGDSGIRYRVSDSITCAQIAALITCHYAVRASGIGETVNSAESFVTMLRTGRIVSI